MESINITIYLHESEIANVLSLCELGLNFTRLLIRQMLHIVGTLNSYNVAIEYDGNNFKHLERDQILTLKRSKGYFNVYMVVTEQGKKDLKWYNNHVGIIKYAIKTTNLDFILITNAFNLDWEAVLSKNKVQG